MSLRQTDFLYGSDAWEFLDLGRRWLYSVRYSFSQSDSGVRSQAERPRRISAWAPTSCLLEPALKEQTNELGGFSTPLDLDWPSLAQTCRDLSC